MSNARVRVLVVCPGLGHITRGYESFTRQCFDAIRDDPRLEARLFKGAGPNADRDRTIWCLRRTGRVARLANLFGDAHHDAYYVEQLTFTLSLLPRLILRRPDVVLLSDPAVGHLLWWWRRATRSRFRLLLSNGGPIGPPAHPRFDHVHQVSFVEFEKSARAGRSAATQSLIPYGYKFDRSRVLPDGPGRARLRQQLGLPLDRPVILSVGVVNRSHKRMDYCVREVAALPAPRPYLVLLGQHDAETPSIIEEANRLLGPDGFRCATVPAAEVEDYYAAADVFALASLHEGFGRVFLEALASGLPSLAHDGPIQRHVLGAHGSFADFTKPGALTQLLTEALSLPPLTGQRAERVAYVSNRFAWDVLATEYVDMILRCAGSA